VVIWYFSPVWVYCIEKNLATLVLDVIRVQKRFLPSPPFPATKNHFRFFSFSSPEVPMRLLSIGHPGCQMVSFRTKNPNLGKFWMALEGKMLIYFRAFFGIFYGHLGIFYINLLLMCSFGTFFLVLVQRESGNPVGHRTCST
jgi:hypothetical protein